MESKNNMESKNRIEELETALKEIAVLAERQSFDKEAVLAAVVRRVRAALCVK